MTTHSEHLPQLLLKPARRVWALPIMRAIEELGGKAPVAQVHARVWNWAKEFLSPEQVQYLKENNRLGWVRQDLVAAGLLGREQRGVWSLTELGRRYLDHHRDDPLDPPDGDFEGGAHAEMAVESVPVTDYEAYHVPILRALATSSTFALPWVAGRATGGCPAAVTPTGQVG